jgi:electron transport complex protein RnfC
MNRWERIRNGMIFSFKGGIYPDEHKTTHVFASRELPFPKRLVIPIKQHTGSAGVIIVRENQHVLAYEPLTKSNSAMAVPIHAPLSGVIEKIGPELVPHPSGLSDICIVIKPDLPAQQQKCKHPDYPMYEKENPAVLLDHIKQMGIAGLGGAGFPTDIKLRSSTNPNNPCELLIINGAECEPYITCDDRLMCEKSIEIVKSIKILQHILKPKFTVIAIEENKPQAIMAISSALTQEKCQDIRVTSLPVKYPSGAARNLIKLITGVEVPYNARSSAYGVVVQNVTTAYAVGRAVLYGEPLVKRMITITGDSIHHIGNYWAYLGTNILEILNNCSFIPTNEPRVIIGGPMMGYTLPNANVPIIKTTNCIIAPSNEELKRNKPQVDCINCGRCAQACPSRLIPYELHDYCINDEHSLAVRHGIKSCIECGCCSFVCPSAIRLVEGFRAEKAKLKFLKRKEDKLKIAKERYMAKRLRLQEEEKLRAERKAQALAKAKALAELKKAQALDAQKNDKAQEDKTRALTDSEKQQILSKNKANTEANTTVKNSNDNKTNNTTKESIKND